MLFFVVPLSTKRKENPFYYELFSAHFTKPSLAILSQVRVIDKKRFVNIIGSVTTNELLIIKKLLKKLYLPGV
jgi:mRNA-degrading endonuclease toxin of MazEF toxin-antitoxin module